MKQLPTVEEFCREKHSKIGPRTSLIDFSKEVMIEFAKLQNEELQMRVKELERMVELELIRRMNGIDDEKKLKINWEEYKSNFLK